MRVDRQTLEHHRGALLAAAGRLFRGRGLGAVTIADVSREAGLTHGAFYGHYRSKLHLAETAFRDSLADAATRWRARAEQARQDGRDPLGAVIDAYLTEAHRDAPAQGCTLGALGAEILRAEQPLRTALAEGTEALAAVLATEIRRAEPALPAGEPEGRALAVLGAMTGGLLLARTLVRDPPRSRDALARAARLARAAATDPTLC